jgi:hypothetical protein
LLSAWCAAAAVVASIASSATPADAHYDRPYRACVVAEHGAWLHTHRCRGYGGYGYGYGYNEGYGCWEPVHRGRAFRVERQAGGYLLVWNLEQRGWAELYALSLAPQAFCRAAGI